MMTSRFSRHSRPHSLGRFARVLGDGQQTLDLLNDLEPYMKGWSRFHQAEKIIHFGPEKAV